MRGINNLKYNVMKKNLKLVAFSAILLMLAGNFFSCGDKEKSFLTVDKTFITATAEAGTYSIAVNSNGAWTVVIENADWCILDNNTGNGDGILTLYIAENMLNTTRSATIKITSESLEKSVVVSQNAAEEPEVELFLIVNKTFINAIAEAGTYFFIISSSNSWTAVVENAEWCTLYSNTGGTGNRKITVNVAENAIYTSRSATIKFTSGDLEEFVTIKQRAAIEPGEYPIEIPFAEFPVVMPCYWENVTFPFPWENIELTIVNSEEEMRNSISCSDGNYPEVDFTEQTLFMTSGTTTSGIHDIEISLSKEAANEYVLKVIVRVNGFWFGEPWHMSIITPKIANDATITLYTQEN